LVTRISRIVLRHCCFSHSHSRKQLVATCTRFFLTEYSNGHVVDMSERCLVRILAWTLTIRGFPQSFHTDVGMVPRLVLIAYFQILSTSSFMKHPTIQRCTVIILISQVNCLRNKLEVLITVRIRVAASWVMTECNLRG
jgi:hypothetical protein